MKLTGSGPQVHSSVLLLAKETGLVARAQGRSRRRAVSLQGLISMGKMLISGLIRKREEKRIPRYPVT